MGTRAGAVMVSPELAGCVQRLAQDASLELNALEAGELDAARLRPAQKIFVSHLPRQGWQQTLALCGAVSAVGCEPVPHIPVRLLESEHQLDELLRAAAGLGVREILLLAGDYPQPQGPFGCVMDVLRLPILAARGFTRVAFAGHPEGHPVVSSREIRQAQVDKWRLASAQGLEVTFVTQFFFAARPFTQWACDLRSEGIQARLVAGLAGPASVTRLLRLARHCGVGPSIRALRARPASMLNLVSDHAPDALLCDLAAEWQRCAGLFDGIHLFSFGGFQRTADWLRERSR